MPAVKLSSFGGMTPAVDSRLLSDNMAASAENVWLYAGTLEGIREPKVIHAGLSSTTKRVFRIPKEYVDKDHIQDSYWLEFPYKDVDVLKSPTSNDSYGRYYWAMDAGVGSEPPRYNTLARIANSDPALYLGITSPSVAPGVSVPTPGSGAIVVTRSYVYTWVSAYGEEGAPSAATVATGAVSASWTITLTAPTSADTTNRNLSKVRIYRTITSSSGVATYFEVVELPITTTSYVDTLSDTVVSGNNQLASFNWTPPPTDLKGMVAMANGMFVGFRANEVWFCEPYRPHAWPADYTLSVDYKIVGLGVVGQTFVVCTEAATYAGTGLDPATTTMSKISSREPCLSRGSIVSMPMGVLYASPNGLMLATQSEVQNSTKGLFTKDKWLNELTVSQLRAAMLGGSYYCFGSITAGCFQEDAFQATAFEFTDFTGSRNGGIIDGNDPRVAFIRLTTDYPTMNVSNDPWTNEVFVLRDGTVYQIDISESRPRSEFTWLSKKFQAPKKQNFEALKIYFDNPEGVADFGTLRIYADDRLVSTRPLVKSGQMIRMPSGFRADFWQLEIVTRVVISNIQMATSARELADV